MVTFVAAASPTAGLVGAGLRWILGTGRLGLDGEVFMAEVRERLTLAQIVDRLRWTSR